MNYTEKLASWAAGTGAAPLDEETSLKASELLLDFAGCALAGSSQPVAEMAYSIIKENFAQAGPCAILNARFDGAGELAAAFQNGFNGHILEMDDVHRGAVFHPGTVVIPAALAIGQKLGASGTGLLQAIAIGYEVSIRVGLAAGMKHYEKWHTTGTCATFGAAAASGHLLRLNPMQMTWALGNAGTQAAGLWQFLDDGALTKPLHPGKAAFNGLLAALMAKNGFTGPNNILEGKKGFLSATAIDPDMEALVSELGDRWQMMDVSIKPYASCRHSHPQIDAALEIWADNEYDVDDIVSVRIRTYQTAINVAGSQVRYPCAPHEAKFDSRFCVALALLKGKVTMEDFDEGRMGKAEDVRLLWEKTAITQDARFEAEYPARWGAGIEMRLKDGRVFSAATSYAKGDPEKPMSTSELIDKFKDLAKAALPEEKLGLLAQRILDLPSADNLNLLF